MLASRRCPGPLRLAVLLAVGLPAALAAEPIHVSGRILQTADRVLAGARVELLSGDETYEEAAQRLGGSGGPAPLATARTDADGFFAIQAPESGCFRVRVRADGYAAEEYPLRPLVEDRDLPPTVLGRAVRREVRVVDRDGRPLAGVRFLGDIWRHGPPGTWWPFETRGVTGVDGRGALPWSTQMVFPRILLVSPLLLGQSAAAGEGPVTLRASAGRSFQIEVRGADDKPMPGALVRWKEEILGLTGPSGRLEVAAPTSGNLPLTVETREGWQARIAVPAGGTPPLVTVRPAPPRTLSGRVVEKATGAPVANAVVWAEERPAAVHTGPDGGFRLTAPAGTVFLEAGAAGHLPAERKSVAQGSSAPVILALEPAAKLSGVVVDAAGRPVSRAGLELGLQSSRPRSSGWGGLYAWSRADGRFQIPGLPFRAGGTIRAQRSGFAEASLAVKTPEPGGPIPPLRIVLGAGLTLSGRTVDEGGRPVAGALVTLGNGAEDFVVQRDQTTSDSAGRFAFRNLSPGKAQLVVRRSGFAARRLPDIEIPAERSALDLGEIELKAGAAIEGRVTDDRDHPVEGAEVIGASPFSPVVIDILEPGEPGQGPLQVKTGPDGTFRLTDLEPGRRTDLAVRHPGYVQANVPGVEVPTKGLLRIELKTAHGLAGRVIGPDGEPVPDASLSWLQETRTNGGSMSQESSLGTTDGDGGFRVTGLAPGPIDLRVSAKGYVPRLIEGVQIPPDRDLEGFEIRLARGAFLEVRVLGPEGDPLPDAFVRAQAVSPGPPSFSDSDHRAWMFNRGFSHTDEEGTCSVELPGPGSYKVMVSPSTSMSSRVTSVLVEAGPGKTPVEVRLAKGVSVSGRVTSRNGEGIPNAGIQLSPVQEGGATYTAGSLPDGSFAIADVTPGRYQVHAGAAGYQDASLPEIEVGGSAVEGIEAQLDEKPKSTATIQGHVLGLDPEELPQVRIQVFGESPASTKVQSDGSYRLQGLAPGSWYVMAQAPSGGQRQAEAQIATEQSEVELDFDFGGLPLSGRVTVDGAPLSGARVHVFQGSTSVAQSQTAYDGTFRVGLPGPGSYDVSVLAPLGTIGYAQTLQVGEGGRPVTIDIPTGSLSGRIVSAGAPVPDARVEIQGILRSPPESFFAPALRSDGSGGFESPRLAVGSYTLNVTKDGFAPATVQIEVRPGTVTPVAIELKPLQ
jgi:carboxypeptidase family protein